MNKNAEIKNLEYAAESWRADSQSLAEIIEMLEEAMPEFKGVPCPVGWAKAAIRKLIEERATGKAVQTCVS